MTKQYFFAASIACLMLSLGSCSKSPTTYYPLGQGRVWTYQMSMKMAFGGEGDATMTVTNLATRQLGGKTVTPQKAKIQFRGESHYSFTYVAEDPSGVLTVANQDSGDVEPTLKDPPEYLLKRPIKTGTTWAATLNPGNGHSVPSKATIESTDETVDVPAGTFKGCVKVHVVGNTKGTTDQDAYMWFAPSVGMIKIIEKEGGTASSMVLESFKK